MDHYQKHRTEFEAMAPGMTPETYLEMADRFIGGALNPATTRECQRQNGDRLRYNEATEELAIMNWDGYIHTYFRPEKRNNLDYFFRLCRQ